MTKPNKNSNSAKPKMTKAERKEKYTRLARERKAQKILRKKGQTLVCFHCRQRGHVAQHCPDATESSEKRFKGGTTPRCCYKCGSLEHALSNCQFRDTGTELPFATCFVCGKQGHLASTCSANDKGIYVKGGTCKTCGSKQHLSKDCPGKSQNNKASEEDSDYEEAPQITDFLEGHGDEQRVHDINDSTKDDKVPTKRKQRIVRF